MTEDCEDFLSYLHIESPRDREGLAAEIFFGDIPWAELNQEKETLEVEFYPRPDGQPWRISFSDAVTVLDEARRRLMGEESEK